MSKHRPSLELVVPTERAGERLDRIVVDLPDVGSRRRARQAIDTGKVCLNGQPCGPGDAGVKVEAGAVVSIQWGRPGTGKDGYDARKGLREAGLQVLHEDDWVVIVNKPPGLLSDTANRRQSMTRDSLRARVQRYLRARGDATWIVHRIDRDTSGVVLVARTRQGSEDLRRQFRQHRPERAYLAVVYGVPEPAAGEWADWMAWDSVHRIQRTTPEETEGAVLARARYRVVERFGRRASLIEVRLVTGRRNQIRLQASLRDHPLYGERLYLPEGWHPPSRPGIERQALHAAHLEIRHPGTRKQLRVEAPLPDDMRRLLERLRAHPKNKPTRKGGR